MTADQPAPPPAPAGSVPAQLLGLLSPPAWLAVLGVLSALLYAILYLPLGPTRHLAGIEQRLVDYSALFALYFLACFIAWRARGALAHGRATALVLGGAVVFRVLVLAGPAAENSDNWRYLWEGRVLLAGMNPYAAPPESPRYDALRRELKAQGDPLFEHLVPVLNSVRSVYGPVATGIFAAPLLLPGDRIFWLRLLMTGFDLGTVLVLMALLRALGRAPALALLYAWSPVCLNAFPDRAHIDAAMVFFLALAAWAMGTRRAGWASVAFGLALLVKMSPLLLALPFLRRGRLKFAVGLAIMVALGAVPFALAGPGSVSGFREFAARWHTTDSIHALVLLALHPLKGAFDIVAVARAIVTVAGAVYAVWRTRAGNGEGAQWLLEACAAIAGAGLLLSPVVHPWYTTHLLIFLCFVPNPGLLLLTCATMSWFVRFWQPPAGSLGAALLHSVKPFQEPWRWVVYPPVYALLALLPLHHRRRRTTDGRPRTTDHGPGHGRG